MYYSRPEGENNYKGCGSCWQNRNEYRPCKPCEPSKNCIEEVEEVRETINEIDDKNKQLENKLDNAKAYQSYAIGDISKITSEISNLENAIEEAEIALSKAKASLEKIRETTNSAKLNQGKANEEIGKAIIKQEELNHKINKDLREEYEKAVACLREKNRDAEECDYICKCRECCKYRGDH